MQRTSNTANKLLGEPAQPTPKERIVLGINTGPPQAMKSGQKMAHKINDEAIKDKILIHSKYASSLDAHPPKKSSAGKESKQNTKELQP